MGLSYDIISEFVKITNDDRSKPREGTVYATIVKTSDGKFVKIDGSDLLTPTETTTDIEDGERVTVMIKDHTATVTGNVSSPSASSNRVDKVVDSVTEQIGVFETVVADKVSVNELEAYKATIEILIAGKAEIGDLEAIYAKIEDLEVKDAEIENAVIDKATIEDLEAINAKIENLEVKDAEIENAVIDNLEATKAEIKILNADFAQIKTLVSGNLTSDNILSFNITADKVTMEDAFIKDAMIDTISAGKINAGQINTNAVTIGSEDGGMRISGATQQFTDRNGNVRIQIGRDSSGDFTFVLYGEDGTGQIINQNGITASAISDGLIINDMVSDDAAISGGKLDISSVITEINNDGSTTIKSNKIHLDGQNQSLEVAFNSLKSQVDTIQDVTIDGDLTSVVEQVQSNTSKIEVNASSINTLIAEDKVIKKQVTDLEGNIVETNNELSSKYASLNQSLEGFKTTVANTYATKSSVNDVKNNLESNYSTTSNMNSAINQKANEITASVNNTYATKNEVKTLDDTIKANYSTTQQMESAISIAKNEINLGVSQIYETKTDVTNKIGDAINNIQFGGRNLITKQDNNFTKWITPRYSERFEISNDNYNNTLKFKTLGSGWEVIYKQLTVSPNKEYTLSFEYSVLTQYEYSGDYRFGLEISSVKPSDNATSYDLGRHIIENKITDLKRVSLKFKPTTSTIYLVLNGGCIKDGQTDICFNFNKFKLELGNQPTDWTPAFEDIETTIEDAETNAITTSNEYTDSQIKISKDSIELGISQTYETKSNVESKVNAAKTEVISSASTDATNKVNAAKTELNEAINTKADSSTVYSKSEVYTKTQTDTQIGLAKDEINLSVSNTYETKTNTTSKINNAIDKIKVGGTNLISKRSNFVYGYLEPSDGRPVDSGDSLNSNQDFYTSDYLFVKAGTPITFTSYPKQGVNSGVVNAVNIHFYNTDKVWTRYAGRVTDVGSIATVTDTPTSDCYVRFSARGFTDYNHMGEFATKPSEWSPSPEDINSDITEIQAETKNLKESVSSLQLGADSINASVKSLEETITNTTNGLSENISSIQKQVDLAMTSDDVKIEIQKQMADGSNRVSTTTGYTFDERGLNISKTDSEMETTITEDGMTVYKNDEKMLVANNQGVDAKNLTATTYLIIGNNSRMETYTENGSTRTAVFWIG